MNQSKSNNRAQRIETSVLFWVTAALVMAFLFLSPYQRALFNGNTVSFERPIDTFLAWGAAGLFFTALYMLFTWRSRDGLDWVSAAVWLIPLSYLVSLSSAASLHLAQNLLFLHVIYAALFVWAVCFARGQWGSVVLQYGIMLSGYMIVMYGWMNWLGNADFPDAVLGNRLSSVFQYPNTYAAYIMALLLGALVVTIHTRRWYIAAGHALLLAPMLISFLLTLSRGALVMLPVALLLLLPFLSLMRQVMLLLYLGIAGAAALLALEPLTQIGDAIRKQFSSSLSLQGWEILLGTAVGTAVFVGALQWLAIRFEAQLEQRFRVRGGRFILPVVAVVSGVVGVYVLFGNAEVRELLPETLQKRVESINLQQTSVLERGTFYRDAMKVVRDYPLFGAGGGAWAALYEKYQNNPYTSRQAHNYFLQSLAEVGIAGFLALIGFLAAVYGFFIRYYIRSSSESKKTPLFFFIVSVSILLHSMIDFNMSYVYLAALVFLSLGGMAAGVEFTPTRFEKHRLVRKWGKAYPAVLCLVAIVLLVVSVRLLLGNSAFNKAVVAAQSTNQLNEIMQPLDQAIPLNPGHPDYVLLKVNLLKQVYSQTKDQAYYDEALALLQGLSAKEPYNRQLFEAAYDLYIRSGELDKALSLAASSVGDLPWELSVYDRIVALDFDLGLKARSAGDAALADKYWDQAIEHYGAVLAKMDELKSLPKGQSQGKPFNITGQMAYAVGQIHFMRGDYEAAVQALGYGPKVDFKVALQRDTTRWYLAALAKTGRNDQALYDKFVGAFPEERQQIDMLVQIQF